MGAMLDAPWNGVVFTPPTAIDIATIEDAIVNRMRSQINLSKSPTIRFGPRAGA